MIFKFLQFMVNPVKIPFAFRLSNEDWYILYSFCKQQALIGIGFTAIEELHKQGVECPKALMMQWLSLTIQIEQRNKQMDVTCRKVTKTFAKDRMNCCILKGQGNRLNYPKHLSLRRQPGDIDLWTVPIDRAENIKKIIAYVKEHAGQHKAIYHHIDMVGPTGIELEVHYRPSFLKSPLRNKKMQRWFNDKTDECMRNRTSLGFSIPTISVNVIYQMSHIYSHLFEGGIGLRQLLDYYYVLSVWYNDCMERRSRQSHKIWEERHRSIVMSPEEIMKVFSSFGMAKFAAAVMWVLQHVFDMPVEWLLCPPDERRGKQLLDEIMAGGNFGQYDIRGAEMKNGGTIKHGIWKLKRVMRLMRNYPEEALCEPLFRVWHIGWRCFH